MTEFPPLSRYAIDERRLLAHLRDVHDLGGVYTVPDPAATHAYAHEHESASAIPHEHPDSP